MQINPFIVAARAKGLYSLFSRSLSIARRYGFTATQMDCTLQRYVDLLQRFDCGATFPITAVTFKRHPKMIAKYSSQNIEFAVHGYTHVDYSRLIPETQYAHLRDASNIFGSLGIQPTGFRSPYLSRDGNLHATIEKAGFSYVSNQPYMWEVLDTSDFNATTLASFKRALAFYNPWQASEQLSLPSIHNHLVEIPVSLPDDEILIDRLGGSASLVEKTWLRILKQSYQQGDLFTLQLHPERFSLCVDGLSAVLTEAHGLKPAVWCARLDEIATWWRARANATIEVTETDDEEFHCVVRGPGGTTVLAREVDINVETISWVGGYRVVEGLDFTFHAKRRPFIGLSPSTSTNLVHFLREQGYIIEISQKSELYSYYIDQANFEANQECTILAQIEGSNYPLVRLGRWPNQAQSALTITGDIDALTLWDYVLRLFGK